MKRKLLPLVLLLAVAVHAGSAFAKDEPFIYVIKKGDTLWGLSERFLKDPHYWPDLWSRNDPDITNPHFIFPGQKVKVYPDRIVVEKAPPAPPVSEETAVPQGSEP